MLIVCGDFLPCLPVLPPFNERQGLPRFSYVSALSTYLYFAAIKLYNFFLFIYVWNNILRFSCCFNDIFPAHSSRPTNTKWISSFSKICILNCWSTYVYPKTKPSLVFTYNMTDVQSYGLFLNSLYAATLYVKLFFGCSKAPGGSYCRRKESGSMQY